MSNAIRLPVPYLSQRDNQIMPSSTCNMTSLAMCLKFYDIPQKTNTEQFEDELTDYALNNGIQITSVYGIAQVCEDYGCIDLVNTEASLDDIDLALLLNHPVIIHGYYTQSGHINVIRGQEDKYYYVNDPWGNLELQTWRYFSTEGENVVFQRRTLAAICSAYSFSEAQQLYQSNNFNEENVSNLWIHEIIKK